MNQKELNDMAKDAGWKTDERGRIHTEIVEATADTRKKVIAENFESKSYTKKHRLQSQVPPQTEKRRIRQQTKVIPTGIYLKTSVAGNSVRGDIQGMVVTIKHDDIGKYVEGMINSIPVYQVVPVDEGTTA